MKIVIKKLLVLTSLLILFSGCGDVSKMKTIAEDDTTSQQQEYDKEEATVFPMAEIFFIDNDILSENILTIKLLWANDSEEPVSFNERFVTFQAIQVQNFDYQNGTPIELQPTPLVDEKIQPQETQELTLRFQLNNREDAVYLTMITTDGTEKHEEFGLE